MLVQSSVPWGGDGALEDAPAQRRSGCAWKILLEEEKKQRGRTHGLK